MAQARLRSLVLLLVATAGAMGLPSGCGYPDFAFQSAALDSGAGAKGPSQQPDSGSAGASGRPMVDGGKGPVDAHATGGRGGAPETGVPACSTDAECASSPLGSLCDVASGACVECLPGKTVCAVGLYCTSEMRCEIGCEEDLDCVGVATGPSDAGVPDGATARDASLDGSPKDAAPGTDAHDGGGGRCDKPVHACSCAVDGDCPIGTVCDRGAGRCVPGCAPGRSCPAGLRCCGSDCANLERSTTHCGECDITCELPGTDTECTAGACAFTSCKAGFSNCNADTKDGCEANLASDPANCSACGKACPALTNADPGCAGGKCALGPCKAGFDDCDRDPSNGCETDLGTDANNCGGCLRVCDLVNASGQCVAGACAVGTCNTGFLDCNQQPEDGCEVNRLGDAANCGACGTVCGFTNAAAKCDQGVCRIDTCLAPRGDCNGDATDGCETNKSLDVDNCGACGAVCAPPNAVPVCSNGACAVASCNTGWADCDGVATNGCEVNTDSDPMHCSSCAKACSTNNATPTCALGACSIACANGFADCDADKTNGCEVDTGRSVDNCGGCGQVCTTSGGTPNCSNGLCGVSTCLAPRADCDATSANGCEVNTSTNVDNCGACGRKCFIANGTPQCAAATCQIATCDAGYADCDGFPQDGCEAVLSDPLNCGSCGQVCVLPNAITSCATGKCEVTSCRAPYADCDGIAANGCETNTETNVKSCGGCGLACNATNGVALCASGVCSIVCAPGFGNCDANVANGCETATANSVQNCGGCGSACSVQNGTPTCLGTTCAIQGCTAGYANCDFSYATGCETRTSDDATNCGTCGHSCSSTNGAPNCTAGACQVACTAGFGDCDANPANGCETNLSGSVANCGACGKACAFPNATATCFSGACNLQACSLGFGDCDGLPANGCEASLATLADCGACGAVCDLANATESCASRSCSLQACAPGFGNCDGLGSTGCEVNTQTNVNNCGVCGNVCSSNNGAAACVLGACTVGCLAGFGNCDGNVANGCEAPLLTSANCGACGLSCTNANGTTACAAGVCVPTCSSGYASCDGDPINGCETNVQTTASACGACGSVCTNGHGSTSCVAGVCAPVCAAGFANCDGDPKNGCETSITTATNCGACGVVCSAINGTNTCTAGACAPVCTSGFGNCDGNPNNGCETSTATSIGNCGTCGKVCPVAGGTPNCVAGVCGVSTCSTGFGDCNGLAGDGCETPLTTLANCGACGSACSLAHATESCASGSCSLSSCDPGFANCDGVPTNGCEVNTQASVSNCGACGLSCSSTNGTATCAAGSCTIACDSGFGDCTGASGCETNLQTSVSSCGACGSACTNANGATTCSGGSCVPSCNPGFASCDGNAANGCETNITTNTANCGACGAACTAANGATACAGGTCTPTCFAGFGNCDGNAANGCETSLTTSITNCGACGSVCSNAHGTTACVGGACVPVCTGTFKDCDGIKGNGCETDTSSSLTSCGSCGLSCNATSGAPSCNSGVCAIACNAGFGDCNLVASDGCEVPLNTTANCGACGAVCTNGNGGTACVSGACTPTCAAGFASCDGNPDNGCERSINTLTDCGGCGAACNLPNAAESCSGGICTLGACAAGFGNCDGVAANGCETNLLTATASCGTCGNVCTNAHGTTACAAGACTPTCVAGWANCDGVAANGCETNTQTSLSDCGACGNGCSLPNATAACSSGVCAIATCSANFGNCDGSAANGCEANLGTSTANCGACGVSCTNANGATSCAAGVCVPTCASGYANCDGSATNGCETSLRTTTNCGGCGAACSLPNATASCATGTCQLVSCNAGRGDCDGLPGNGCETNTQTSTSSCGACGAACSTTNGNPTCTAGACAIACNAGFGNCNGQISDGCETNLSTSVTDCNACGTACSFAHAGASCASGSCQMGACVPGFASCDGQSSNGCETSLTTLANCGACGTACDLANASESCASGSCTLGACAAGFEDCDGIDSDGCEVNTQTSVSNCGYCGNVCSASGGTANCIAGVCGITVCNPGFGDCNGSGTDGCETNLNTNLSNCGGCGSLCSLANAAESCVSGVCTLGTCAGSFGNCDSDPTNGCETNTSSTVAHCGACGQPCSSANGTASCALGACSIVCSTGFGNCDTLVSNGCEASLNATANCGACGASCTNANGTTSCPAGTCLPVCASGFASCDGNPANGCETSTTTLTNCGGCGAVCNLANASETCPAGVCTLGTCSAGFGNCDGDPSNGCETNLNTTVTSCGACGAACTNPHGGVACTAGKCAPTCTAGFGDCDGDLTNGCETNLNTTVTNCGVCGNACTFPQAGATCSAGACVLGACNAGFGNCNGVASDGCEANLNTSTANCSACGAACSNANGTTSCSAGVCVPACAAGYASCDGNPTNGCEKSIRTVTDCNGCGVICDLANAAESCASGTCTLGTCTAGFGNCNGVAADGCETNLTTSATNCGGCGAACSTINATPTCSASVCSLACSVGFGNCNGLVADGCETNTNTSATNCGACGTVCSFANAGASCFGGACQLGTCNAGFANCDGNAANGCETALTSLTNCGACGAVCDFANAAESCGSGVCSLGACSGGFGNCNSVAGDGCEANTQTSTSNCGTCGTVCSSNNGTPSCASGTCGITCTAGFGNCDVLASNGCEASLHSTTNCGVCGTACANSHGTTTCPSGTCTPACSAGWGDCDSLPNNGCETDTQATVAHCSGCGLACTNPNGTTSCAAGTCVPVCNAGFGNCDGNARNGCETPLNTTANCGACGLTCGNSNGSTTCTAGVCVPTCASGFKSCDGNPNNGCETNVNTDVNNCTNCGNVCPSTGGTANCVGGVCGISSCSAGLGDCDGLSGNGCETNLTNSLQNCGNCGAVCNLANASESCTSSVCTLGTCNGGFGNCDASSANGCETNTDISVTHCGSCPTSCSGANGTPSCSLGACAIACNSGFGNCDLAAGSNGCEVNLSTSLTNCGTCGNACTNPHGGTTCTAGGCVPTCNAGFGNCDANLANGCEVDFATNVTSCGACGQACTNAHGTTSCAGGACVPVCNSGFADCDGNPKNGCETGTTTDAANCGACGQACTNANGSTSCVAGVCTPVCSGSFRSCDSNPNNGCETNTDTSLTSCGGCGLGCSGSNASATCSLGSCSLTCNSGFGNCNGGNGDGCEVNLGTDPNHCGTCPTVCSNSNGSTTCTAGACVPTCSPNYKSCDGNANNGCERNIATVTDCADCNVLCDRANAAESCPGGVCTLGACSGGFGNCDGNASNGCETNTTNNINNCGACASPCNNPNGSTTCTASACVPTCNAGFGNCDGNAPNGCETNTTTSATNCGGCGTVCNGLNGTPSCGGGVCAITCSSGYGDCDTFASTGCEINLNTSASNCGSCGTVCSAVNGTNACASGTCNPACNSGYGSCDGDPKNGCETNLTNTGTSCGACGTTCANPHGTTSCSTSVCQPVCTAGYGNCDSNATNGCETSTDTSLANCGGCGAVCSFPNASATCSLGACALGSCNAGYSNCDGNNANGCEALGSTCGNCTDGVQNGAETGVDCGGSCPGCPWARWAMNEVSGTTASDWSGNARNGTLVSFPASPWVAGQLGGALTFDGTDDHVVMGNISPGTGPITITAWITTTTSGGTSPARNLLSKRDNAQSSRAEFEVDRALNSDEMRFSFNVAGTWYVWETTNFNLAVNTWTHFAVTYAAGAAPIFYKNGATTTLTQTFGSGAPTRSTNTAELRIGSEFNGVESPWSGKVDDLRIYDRVLTQAQVQTAQAGN